jgi:hypothetical protein
MMYICISIASLGSAGEVINIHVLKGFCSTTCKALFYFMLNKTAILYSPQQKCFHIEILADYITGNIKSILLNSSNQFELVGIADNDEQGDQIIRTLTEKFKW